MQGFKPTKEREKDSAQSKPAKAKPQISPKKEPDAQAQQLNQAPDSVPAMVKPGEYVLPPDTVDAVGGPEALNQVVEATHTPASEAAVVPQGFEPQLYFANGGQVPDEEKRRVLNVPASMQRRENTTFGPGNTIVENPAPAPVAPMAANTKVPAVAPAQAQAEQDTMAGKAAYGFHPNITARAERAPAGVPMASAPAASSTPAPAAKVGVPKPASPTAMFVEDALTDAGQRWDRGEVAGAMGAGARAALGGIGMGAVEALDKTVVDAGRGIARGAAGFWDGLIGNEAQAAPAPQQAAAPAAPVPAVGNNEKPVEQAQPEAQAPAAPAVAPAAPQAQDTTTATEIAPGVYRNGPGQYSDSPTGMGFSPRRGEQPSAQNQRAAEQLAANQQLDSIMRIVNSGNVPSAPDRGFIGRPMRRPAPGDPRTEQEREKILRALTTPYKGAQNGQLTAAQLSALMNFRRQEADAIHNAESIDASLMQTQMRESGETARANARNALDQQRLGMEGIRLGMEGQRTDSEVQERGFRTRALRRQEALHERYEKAKTPEERSAIAEQIMALNGNSPSDNLRNNFMTVGGGQEWDAQAGTMRNVPQRLIDLRTGQEVGVGTQKQVPIAENPKAIAIKNDTSMSIEQKRKALQELGYF